MAKQKPIRQIRQAHCKQVYGKHFYNHIIETSVLSLELGELNLSQEERVHLISLVEANIHTAVVDAILSELKEEDKRIFLMHLSSNDHDKIWNHLKTRIENVEEKIKKVAEDVKKELHNDIKEIKNK